MDLIECVHGWDGSTALGPRSFSTFAPMAIAAGFQVDVIDLPGTDNYLNAAAIATRIAFYDPAVRVHVLGHSMGCLSLREYLKHLGGASRVANYVALDGPQFGTWDALRPWTWCPQITPPAPFIRNLNTPDATPGDFPYVQLTAKYSDVLPGVYHKAIEGVDHRGIVQDPATLELVLNILKGDLTGLQV